MVNTLFATHKGSKVAVLVDEDIAGTYKDSGLSVGSHGYAQICRVDRRRVVLLHRVIVQAPKGSYVDHINGDRLDCRRENLRLCTNSQNCCNRPATRVNTSGFKGVGVVRRKFGVAYIAQIKVRGEKFHIGTYPTAEIAAQAYDEASLKLHGDFAAPNF